MVVHAEDQDVLKGSHGFLAERTVQLLLEKSRGACCFD